MDLHFNTSNFESYIALMLVAMKERPLTVYYYDSKLIKNFPIVEFINPTPWSPSIVFDGLVISGMHQITRFLDLRYPFPEISSIIPHVYARSVYSFDISVSLVNEFFSKYKTFKIANAEEFGSLLADFIKRNKKAFIEILTGGCLLLRAFLASIPLMFEHLAMAVASLVPAYVHIGGLANFLVLPEQALCKEALSVGLTITEKKKI